MESGTRLGLYAILEQLGADGMGEVWLAQDTRLGRTVAIRVLPENVFVGHAKVLDFGLAKLTEVATGGLSSESISPMMLGTQAGVVTGTAGYLAPGGGLGSRDRTTGVTRAVRCFPDSGRQ